ncbi:MAG: type III-A CRISPR-associated RAMP protein Csm5, partial [Peptococcales bacterium]
MKFLLETLSPINIGNASVLSPYSDYYYDNGFVYYINQDRLSQEIAKLPNADEVTDKYVAFIKQQSKSNNPEKYNIKDFLMDAGIDLLHVANVKLEANTKITEEINRTINTSGRPYIPGSTLKGAIRTGIMVSEYLDSKNFDYYQAKRINGYIGQELFGNYDKDIFKHLAVSDTSLFSEKDKKVIKTYRYNLKTNQKTIPVVKEVIKTGSFAEFSIKTMGNEKIHNINQKHSYLL